MRAVRRYTLTIFAGKRRKSPHTLTSLLHLPSLLPLPSLPSLRLPEAEAGAEQVLLEEEAGAEQQLQEEEAGGARGRAEAGQQHNCFAAQSRANAKLPRKCWKMSDRSG